MKRIVCHVCGREFDAVRGNRKFCPECAAKRKREHSRRHGCPSEWSIGNGLTMSDAIAAAFPPSVRTIMNATSKPLGCSDARWRMELRRRADRARFADAPDADTMQGSGGHGSVPILGSN